MTEAPRPEIGRYQVLEPIGAGAMGTVFLALDPVLKRKVAIKVMADSVANDPELRSRFLREAQSAGSLQHPNIVTIFDFGDVDGDVFIAMEFVEGTDLSVLLREPDALPMHRKLEIMIDLLKGLAYAHRHGIVHRDVKPGNIRITPDGIAKLMDFGLVHMAATKLTSTGALLGTPHYMAPEQITMSGALSPASDVFSAGGVLYELLTGQPAFTGDTVHRVMYRIVSEAHVPLAIAAPDAPPALEAVLRRALAKDPADRYRDASEMLSALTPIAAAAAGTSRAHTTLEHAVSESLRLNRTQPVPAVAAVAPARAIRWRVAALPVAATVVLVGSLVMFQRDRPAAPDAPPAQPAAVSALPATQAPLATNPDSTTTLAPNDSGSAPRIDAAPAPPKRSDTQKAPAVQRQAAATTPNVSAPAVKQARESSIVTRTPANASTAAADTLSVPPRTIRADPPPLAVADVPPVSKGPVIEAPRPVTREEIDALVRAYAEAIESRNTAAVRQLYPAIRSDQLDGFQRFFASVRTLRVSLSLDPVQLGAGTATGRISGSYDFTNAQGQANRQPVSFQATFRRAGDRWVIESVR